MVFKSVFWAGLLLLCLLCVQQLAGQEVYPGISYDGVIKTKYEYATETGMSRFSVRNSRMGLKGKLSAPVSYRVQVELSSSGEFEVLDLSGTLNLFKNFYITLGQTGIPIYNSYITSPADIMYANRAFIGKYFTGTRDIGALAEYSFNAGSVPVTMELGVFNGNTINDPVWTGNLAYAARVQFGTMEGLRSTVKVYDYPKSVQSDYFIWGADLRYGKERFSIESELMSRYNRFDKTDRLSLYLQGAYSFPLERSGGFHDLTSGVFHDVTPIARWDAIGENVGKNDFDVTRLTLGVNLGLNSKVFDSSLRFNYEHYFVERAIPEFDRYEEMDSNKFTVELLIIF